jgi:hypothetical protein
MSNIEDHRWDSNGDDEVWDHKLEEWGTRDWPEWLAQRLAFPFTAKRDEDDDDAYFLEEAAQAPFRLGHKMEVLSLAEEDVDKGIIVEAREKNQTGRVPLCDLKVVPTTDLNFWPVREYVVWFANQW